MRADARKNHDHLLAVAGAVITEQGAEASMRDIARRAGVGLATLLRHFPTREALLEALLRTSFDELTAKAGTLETSSSTEDALVSWLRDFVACAHNYRGVVALMVTAIEDTQSALHASCVTMRAAGTRLLARAQGEGMARTDIDGTDLFALAGSLAWLGDQPSLAPRVDHLFGVVVSAILTNPASTDPRGNAALGPEADIVAHADRRTWPRDSPTG
ncbi:TetR/AcrR family transcriptional regulator [Streptomyces sp. LZ34]